MTTRLDFWEKEVLCWLFKNHWLFWISKRRVLEMAAQDAEVTWEEFCAILSQNGQEVSSGTTARTWVQGIVSKLDEMYYKKYGDDNHRGLHLISPSDQSTPVFKFFASGKVHFWMEITDHTMGEGLFTSDYWSWYDALNKKYSNWKE
jgi:hypothetical protein